VCCSVLQMCCSVLQCVAVCLNFNTEREGQFGAATHCNTLQHTTPCNILQHTATQNECATYSCLCAATHKPLQHTATNCNTEQMRDMFLPLRCNTLQHTATRCNTLQHTATYRNNILMPAQSKRERKREREREKASRCVSVGLSLPHEQCRNRMRWRHIDAATYCNTLQHFATPCNTLQHLATRCNILQHTATHCNIE